MKIFYEKIEESELKESQEFIKKYKDTVDSNDVEDKARELLEKMRKMHSDAIDVCTKELRDTINKFNSYETSDAEKARLFYKDNEVKIFLNKAIIEVIDELWEIEKNNFKNGK